MGRRGRPPVATPPGAGTGALPLRVTIAIFEVDLMFLAVSAEHFPHGPRGRGNPANTTLEDNEYAEAW